MPDHNTCPTCGQRITAAKSPKVRYSDDLCKVIYNAYPRKVGKVAALKAIRKALVELCGRDNFDGANATYAAARWLERVVVEYAHATARWPPGDKKYIPHPATWFNQGRYDDDPGEWDRPPDKPNQPPPPPGLPDEVRELQEKMRGGGE